MHLKISDYEEEIGFYHCRGGYSALFVIHFGKLPEQIDPEEINEYLAGLACDPKSPSRSSFKHMVYGLRYYYRLLGVNKNAIALPSLKGDTKLPIILNYKELKELFAAPSLLKQRIVLTLIYSAGLRGQEVINLKISDVDTSTGSAQVSSAKPFTSARVSKRKTVLYL